MKKYLQIPPFPVAVIPCDRKAVMGHLCCDVFPNVLFLPHPIAELWPVVLDLVDEAEHIVMTPVYPAVLLWGGWDD